MRVAVLTLCAIALGGAVACADSEPRLRIVAAAYPWQASECDKVPLQIIEWPSDERRIGPSERYLTFVLSPSGDRVAASRWNWNYCLDNDDVAASEQTFSLIVIDVATHEVTELLVEGLPIQMIQWSADGEHLAFVGLDEMAIVEIDAGERMRTIPLEGASGWQNRGLFVGPEGGDYLFVYARGQSFFGIPRDHDAELVSWTPECSNSRTLFAQRLKAVDEGELTAYYLCGNDDDPSPYRWEATIDLETGELSPGEGSPDLQGWLGVYGEIGQQVRGDHPGAAVWHSVGTDYRQELAFLATTYSPSGTDVNAFLRENEAYPADTKSAIVLRTAEGEFTYVPVELNLGPTRAFEAYGPLHDVVILK